MAGVSVWAGVGALLWFFTLVPASAQTAAWPSAAQQKVLQQVALGQARTELFARLRALPAGRDVTVGDWLSGDIERERALRLWLRKQPRRGSPRLYSDGVCEVDASIQPEELREELLRLLEDYTTPATSPGVDSRSIKGLARRWPMVWATGRALLSRHARPDRAPGWEDVTSEGLVLARRAAEADAYHALLEEAGRLMVSDNRRLREFLQADDAVRAAVREALRRQAAVKVEYEPDQVAVARVRIGLRELLRILTRVHEEHYRGDQFEVADFREMRLRAAWDELTASGLAQPPPRTILRNRYEPIEYNTPSWATETVSAAGRYEPVDGESPDEAAKVAAARLDALDNLRRKVEQLVIQKGVTVGEYLGYHQDLKGDVVLFLSGARPAGRPRALPAGGVEVKVELPLLRLWEIVRRKMKQEEVEPPTE
ncbi:MAG: hypothetical protein KAY37_05235 [Phycisphaerae bacterium]|nr:hypothetical protein [Phycisphaerae bacterium]